MSKRSALRQLAEIISESVDKIEIALEQSNVADYPSLDEPFNPTSPEEGASMSPAVRHAAEMILAASSQLTALVNMPVLGLYNAAGGFLVSSAMRVATEGCVAEILRGKPEGLHIDKIAAISGADSGRLGRNLRLLATRYIFKEVAPNVFANNRLSSMLDTLKSVEEIRADPVNKHANTPGITALMDHTTDEVMKPSAFLADVLYDPAKKSSEAPEDSPLAHVFKTDKTYFRWLEEPGNELRMKRFAVAMEGSAKINTPDAILAGFKWESLEPGAVVVDVGSGTGHICVPIAQKRNDLRFILQDRPSVIEEAKVFWEQNMPSAVKDGIVTFQKHDFFTPQPKVDAAVFMCRMVLHDFPTNKAKTILKYLRDVANPHTKLIIIEQIVAYACPVASSDSPFSAKLNVQPPEPLLSIAGNSHRELYYADLHLFNCDLGEERTVGAFEDLFRATGWKLIDILIVPGSIQKQLIAVPI